MQSCVGTKDATDNFLNPFTNATRGVFSVVLYGYRRSLRWERCVDTMTIKCVVQHNERSLARAQTHTDPGDTSRKVGWRRAAHFPKPLP